MRNYLEHEYKCPEQERVEDAIDVANLFVISLDRALHSFPECFIFGLILEAEKDSMGSPNLDKQVVVHFDNETNEFTLKANIKDGTIEDSLGSRFKYKPTVQSTVKPQDRDYINLVRLSLRVEKEHDPENALRDFLLLSR